MSLHHYIASDSPPGGLFRYRFRRETEKGVDIPGVPELFTVLDLALPSGTVHWAKTGVSKDLYQYEPRVSTFGSLTRSFPVRTNDLASVEATVVIEDKDRVFAREVASHRSDLRRSAATIRYISPNVSDADSSVRFQGILSSWSQSSQFTWELRIRPDDLALEQGKIPDHAITDIDWPAADPEALGARVPIVLGEHDSAGLTAEGMLPTFYVDTVGFRYLVGIGKLTVSAVYADGEIVSASSYSITYPIVNGLQVTLVDFTTDQESATVTVDATGLTDTGETTGTVVTNPARQLALLLRLFVFNNWRSGAYPTTDALENGSFEEAASYFDLLSYEGSMWYGGDTQTDARTALNDWAQSNGCKVFWTATGRISVRVISHIINPDHLYRDDQWFRGDEYETGTFSVVFDDLNLTKRLSVEYLFDEVAGGYAQTLEIEDLSVTDDVTTTKQLPWAARRIT